MDRIYRGDPGVPHTDPATILNIWTASFTFSAVTWFDRSMWRLFNRFNWQDQAMKLEQQHWKKAMENNWVKKKPMEKNKPYQFKRKQVDRTV